MLKKLTKKYLFTNNKELLLGLIVGLILSSTTVFAVIKYASSNVFYRNTNSHLSSTTVQGAIDELYNTCTSRTYTLTANGNGGTIPTTTGWTGSGTSATKAVVFNSSYGLLPTPTRSGYEFAGWYTKSTDGTVITSSSIYRYSDNSTIYAHWSTNAYTISYTMNGGSNPNPKPTNATYDSDVTIGTTTQTTKTVTVNPNANETGATIGSATSATQTFAGWSSTTLGSNAKTGTSANPTTSWTGAATTNKYFRNLRESGTVTMVANWSGTITLPTLSKTGYTCKWYTESSGGSEMGSGGATWTVPSTSATSVTAYARCTANELIFNNQTLSSGTYGTTYTSDAFTEASDGTGSYTYSIESGAPSGATIDSTNRTISFDDSTDAGTYNVVVKATDDNSEVTKNATMTIIINKKTLACPSSPEAQQYTGDILSSGITCPSGSTAGGDQSATDRGTYSQTCTPTSNYQFSSTCSVDWTISCNTKITGTVSAGQTVTYPENSEMNWTVVSVSGNDVNLAYNGVSGSGAYTGATTAVKALLDSNDLSKDALEGSCIVNNGSSSNSKVNAPANYYWLTSGTIYTPSDIHSYGLTRTTQYYAYTEVDTDSWNTTALYNSSVATSYTTTLKGNATAGGSKTVDNSATSVTFNNSTVNNSGSFLGAPYFHVFTPSKGTGTKSSTRVPMFMHSTQSGNNQDYTNTKIYKMTICGGNHDSKVATFQPYSSSPTTQYYYYSPAQNRYFNILYTTKKTFYFAGTPSSSYDSSTDTRTFNYKVNSGCSSKTIYTLGNTTVNLTYRPYITVKNYN